MSASRYRPIAGGRSTDRSDGPVLQPLHQRFSSAGGAAGAITARVLAREQAKLLRQNATLICTANVSFGVLLYAAFYASDVPLSYSTAWLALLLLAAAARHYVLLRLDSITDDAGIAQCLRQFVVSSAAMGVVWGACGLALQYDSTDFRYAAIIFVLAGMSAAAAATTGILARSAVAYVVPTLFPTYLFLMSTGRVSDFTLAVMGVVYCLIICRVAHVMEKSLLDLISARIEQVSTFDDLERLSVDLERKREELQIIADYTYAWETWFADDGTALWINPAVERVTGYTVDDCAAMDAYPLDIVHPDDRERIAALLVKARTVPSRGETDFRIVRKDGIVRRCAALSLPAMDKIGNRRGFRASVRDVTEERNLREELERLAATDPLTGALNRRRFFELYDIEVYRAGRYGSPISLAVFDVDRFKLINDRYGHTAGDKCLKAFVSTVRADVRETDLLVRFGGEEFVLLMPETGAEDAVALCDRIRQKVAGLSVRVGNRAISMTVSAGVTEVLPSDTDADIPLHRADAGLYEAKGNGRNAVVFRRAARSTETIGTG